MRLLIHTIRALNYTHRHGTVPLPEEVCPDSRLREVERELEALEIIPKGDRLTGGVPPFFIQPGAQGRVEVILKQYRREEAAWRLLESLRALPRGDGDVVEAVVGLDVDGEPLAQEEVEDAATELADLDMVKTQGSWGRDHLRLTLKAGGRQLLASERAPHEFDFDGHGGVVPGVVNNAENYALNNYGNMAAGAVGPAARAHGQQSVNGADVAAVLTELRQAIGAADLDPEYGAALLGRVDVLEESADAEPSFVLRQLERLRDAVVSALGEKASGMILSKIGLLWAMFGGQWTK